MVLQTVRIYTRYVSCSNLGQDTESEASLFLVPQDKTGIIPKLGQYLNIVHNFRLLLNYQKVLLNTFIVVCLQYYILL